MNTEPGIVIIGAGEAGACAAVALREHLYGGPITLIGEECHPCTCLTADHGAS
jgi:3-phenylpropionate/trans-cinnamate dioxygenase ferredoxin reductase subunit